MLLTWPSMIGPNFGLNFPDIPDSWKCLKHEMQQYRDYFLHIFYYIASISGTTIITGDL